MKSVSFAKTITLGDLCMLVGIISSAAVLYSRLVVVEVQYASLSRRSEDLEHTVKLLSDNQSKMVWMMERKKNIYE